MLRNAGTRLAGNDVPQHVVLAHAQVINQAFRDGGADLRMRGQVRQ